jgi:hypothetical protein
MKAVAMRPLEGRRIKFLSPHFSGLSGHYRTGDECVIGLDISVDNALMAWRKFYFIDDMPEPERPGNEEVEVDSPATREELKKRRGDAFFRHLQAYARNEMMRYVAIGLLIVIAASHIADKYLDRQEAAHAARMVSMAQLEGTAVVSGADPRRADAAKGDAGF